MRRRVVRIVAFVASVVSIMMTVSCSKEGVGGVEYALTLGDTPDSFGNGEGMVQFNDRAFKKAMLEVWDSDRDGDISPDEALAAETVEAVGVGVHDLTGIEAFRNVWKIDLRDNDIVDATAVKDHPFLHWLDLNGNRNLATFDVRGCTIYFDHCEFEVTDDLLYYCWRRQVNISTVSDPENRHSKHVKDGRETADWSRHTRLVQLHQHTKGEGKFKVNFSGLGYIDIDLEDGSFDRIMREGYEAILEKCPRFASHLDELDVYYMEYLSPHHEMYIYELDDFGKGHPAFDAAMEEHKNDNSRLRRTSWNMVTDYDSTPYRGTGEQSAFAVLTITFRLAFYPGVPQTTCLDGYNEDTAQSKPDMSGGNGRNWYVDMMLNTNPDDKDKEYVYVSNTPAYRTDVAFESDGSIMRFLDMCFGQE